MTDLQQDRRPSLAAQTNDGVNGQDRQWPPQLIAELELLSSTIQYQLQDINKPLKIILGLSELLLARLETDDPLAVDLSALLQQAGRMSQTIKSVNGLIDQKHRRWKQLRGPRIQEYAELTTTAEGEVE